VLDRADRPPSKLEPPPARPRTRPRSSTASAVRKRAYRERRKAGGFIARICIDPPIVELLIEAQFLPAWDSGDRAAVERALRDYLFVVSRYETP
jgi:hypothetical protein